MFRFSLQLQLLQSMRSAGKKNAQVHLQRSLLMMKRSQFVMCAAYETFFHSDPEAPASEAAGC